MKYIYKKLKSKKIQLSHVCEVGVYLPETSNIIDFIKDGIRTTLVEADPVTVEKIKDYFKEYNILLYPYAVWDHNGTIRLSKAEASTFVTELQSSPAIENDNYQIREEQTFEVPCKIFSEMDDKKIDLLSIDIEGCEWYVLKHLLSRPKILSVETHGKYYTNPFIDQIRKWMSENNYVIWYKDGSDTVFVRKDVFLPSFADRLETGISDLKVAWKKFKKLFKR